MAGRGGSTGGAEPRATLGSSRGRWRQRRGTRWPAPAVAGGGGRRDRRRCDRRRGTTGGAATAGRGGHRDQVARRGRGRSRDRRCRRRGRPARRRIAARPARQATTDAPARPARRPARLVAAHGCGGAAAERRRRRGARRDHRAALHLPRPMRRGTALIAAKTAHPTVGIIAVVNPTSGPGSAVSRPAYTSRHREADRRRHRVIGYVGTDYTAQDAPPP